MYLNLRRNINTALNPPKLIFLYYVIKYFSFYNETNFEEKILTYPLGRSVIFFNLPNGRYNLKHFRIAKTFPKKNTNQISGRP